VQFIDVIIRQAHPGPGALPYRTAEEKLEDARLYKQHLGIPWMVLADDLEGTVHQIYGGLSDPAYLMGADGRVSHYNIWTNVPTLDAALCELERNGWSGTVKGTTSALPQMLAAATFGWPALRRGLPDSYIDLETAFPGLATTAWLGHRLKALLAPLASRSRPLPSTLRATLAVTTATLALAVVLSRLTGKK
jgi:hypothetical protein